MDYKIQRKGDAFPNIDRTWDKEWRGGFSQ
jgi:hypothetical protein